NFQREQKRSNPDRLQGIGSLPHALRPEIRCNFFFILTPRPHPIGRVNGYNAVYYLGAEIRAGQRIAHRSEKDPVIQVIARGQAAYSTAMASTSIRNSG